MAITKLEGERFIKEYLRIREELLKLENFNNSSDENLKKYHSSGFISYIFTKERIDALFQYANDANALRIYYGAHSNGEPTLVIVPCSVSADEKSAENKLSPDGARADQHPKPKTRGGGFGLLDFDLGNDPI